VSAPRGSPPCLLRHGVCGCDCDERTQPTDSAAQRPITRRCGPAVAEPRAMRGAIPHQSKPKRPCSNPLRGARHRCAVRVLCRAYSYLCRRPKTWKFSFGDGLRPHLARSALRRTCRRTRGRLALFDPLNIGCLTRFISIRKALRNDEPPETSPYPKY